MTRKRRRPVEVVAASAILKRTNRLLLLCYTAISLVACRVPIVVEGQFDGFEPSTAPCPSSSPNSITGYSTIAAMNSDMDQELTRISEGGTPQQVYFMILCPQTTFDTSSGGPLLPRLGQATFSCGGQGNVDDGCVFSGGDENIRIDDPDIEGYNVNAVNFVGITFTAFTGRSVELAASAPTVAVFMNCLWQDFNAEGIVRILNTNEGSAPMDMEMEMCTISSSSGQDSDSVVKVAFENNGGSMQFVSIMVQNIEVDIVFSTLENGATVVSQSAFNENSMARFSGTEPNRTASGMSSFSGITIADNVDTVLMFEVDGEGSSTTIQTASIERNLGSVAFQILLVTDGGVASLLNSTILSNNPVEYGVYVLVSTPGTAPFATIEDSTFQSNTQEDWALVMSEGEGANVVMARNQFIENTGGLMNIGAFFGGAIQFTQTCFERNNHFLVALILEFSTFVASENYVDQEVSQICSGEGEEEGPGRLSVEQMGSLCFRGGEDCLVDCLPNANDSPVCLARQLVGTSTPSLSPAGSGPVVSPAPSVSAPLNPTPLPTLLPPPPTISPTAMPLATEQPVSSMPIPFPSQPTAPSLPSAMPAQLPSVPTNPPMPAVQRPPFRPLRPTISALPESPVHLSPVHYAPTCTGKGDCHDDGNNKANPDSGKQSNSHKSAKSQKTENSQKKDKKSKKDSNSQSSQDYSNDDESYYGIGDQNTYPIQRSHQQEEQMEYFGIGNGQPRSVHVEALKVEANNHETSTSSKGSE